MAAILCQRNGRSDDARFSISRFRRRRSRFAGSHWSALDDKETINLDYSI